MKADTVSPMTPHFLGKLVASPISIHQSGFRSVAAIAAGPLPGRRLRESVGYEVHDKVAIIKVEGVLVHKLGTPEPWGGMVGCDGIRIGLLGAIQDPKVKAVLLCMKSPGGPIAGTLDLADQIHAARAYKPIWSLVDDMACGSAYVLASAASRVITTRTAFCGGVGVANVHADFSKALHDDGIDVTIFTHGDRKAAGNPYNQLTREDRAQIQAEIDELGELLTATVARNRGTKPKTIRALEGRHFLGEAAVHAGLADKVQAPDEAFSSLIASLKGVTK